MRELFGYEEIPFDDRNLIVYLGAPLLRAWYCVCLRASKIVLS